MAMAHDQAAARDDAALGSGDDDLRELVRAQAAMIDDLERRLALVEADRAGSPIAPPVALARTVAPADDGETTTPAPASDAVECPAPNATSRRQLLTRGAAAAASAVVGTAAVGAITATPAAAASGSFDGSPAVTATANPASGLAINATSSAVAIYAERTSGSGPGYAIQAVAHSPGAITVSGANDAASGSAVGVQGSASSPAGFGALGINNATSGLAVGVGGRTAGSTGRGVEGTASHSTGSPVGVYGETVAVAGRGVEGRNKATDGFATGVLGGSASAHGQGVYGTASATEGQTIGVLGDAASSEGTGVYGIAFNPFGLTVGVGGQTFSPAGIAVDASDVGSGTGLRTSSDRTQVQFAGSPAAPPSTTGERAQGELVFDTNLDLWLCVASGYPGTWRKIAGPATAGAFTILPSTIRIYDSRAGLAPLNVPKGQLGNNQTRTLDAKVAGAVPAGATAVLVNLTIVNTGDPGFLALYKNGIPYPNNSTINWNQPGTLLANSAVVALDDQARFAVKANVGFCDFVIDAIGFYR